IVVLPGGDLAVGGDFTAAGAVSASRIARFNQSTRRWSAFGSGADSSVSSLLLLGSGELIVGGGFATAGGVSAAHVARLNPRGPQGSVWSALAEGVTGISLPNVYALALLPGGDIVC